MTDRPTSDTAPTAREQSRQAFVYEAILDSMSDGMMTVDFEGRIRGLNPAAERILGVPAAEAAGTTLVEFFFGLPDNDAFLDAILAAIAPNQHAGAEHRHYLDFKRPDGGAVSLGLTISDLRRQGEDGQVQRLGVVCVFSDVTELRDLRAAEQEMARQLEENHRKLAAAYRDLEQRSTTVAGSAKRLQVWRIGITAAVITVFTGVGLYAWFSASGDASAPAAASVAPSGTPRASWTVQPRPLRKTIDLVGQIEPGHTVSVLAPFAGPLLEKHFEFGARVQEGDLLAVLDTAELDAQYRDAKAGLIKAEQNARDLTEWAKGVEVARARRGLQSAERTLQSAQQKTRETKQLLDLGVVARQEYQDALDRETEAERAVLSAREELDGVLDKGSARNRQVAELELANARQKLQDLERKLESARIRAPAAGVVIRPPTQTGGSDSGGSGGSAAQAEITQGTKVTEAQALLAIAALDNLRVNTSLLEIDVNKVATGMKVLVTGEAFPGTTLEGKLTSIANQASKGGGSALPQFGISVLIEAVGEDIGKAVRLGMTASLQIVTHDDPAALVVPVDAISLLPEGTVVTRRDPATGQTTPVPVTLGQRLPTGVQILSGLSAGDEVVY